MLGVFSLVFFIIVEVFSGFGDEFGGERRVCRGGGEHYVALLYQLAPFQHQSQCFCRHTRTCARLRERVLRTPAQNCPTFYTYKNHFVEETRVEHGPRDRIDHFYFGPGRENKRLSWAGPDRPFLDFLLLAGLFEPPLFEINKIQFLRPAREKKISGSAGP